MEWISVKDRLPSHGDDVNFYTDDGFVWSATFVSFSDDAVEMNGIEYAFAIELSEKSIQYADDVTHWMPLPEPPKEGEEKRKERFMNEYGITEEELMSCRFCGENHCHVRCTR